MQKVGKSLQKNNHKTKPMKIQILAFSAIIVATSTLKAQYQYPKSKTVDVVETHWGMKINDPYRWIEDIKNPEVINWFKAQSEYTNSQLAKMPGQEKLVQEFRDLDAMRSVRYNPVAKAGGLSFYDKSLPGEQVNKFYSKDIKTGKETLIFDPQTHVAGKTFDFETFVSNDGSRILFSLSEAGNEVSDLHIYDVKSGKFLPEIIPLALGPSFVSGSNDQITYTQLKNYDVHDPETMLNMPCKIHIVGTPVSSDKIVISATTHPDFGLQPQEMPSLMTFENSPYLFLVKLTVEKNLTIYFAPKSELNQTKINWKPLTSASDEVQNIIAYGNDLYLLSAKGNPHFNILKTNLQNPDLKKAEIVFKGNPEWKISKIYSAKDFIIINKSKNELIIKQSFYDLKTGKISSPEINLQGNIKARNISTQDNEILLVNSGWNIPNQFSTFDLETEKMTKNPFEIIYKMPFVKNLVVEEIEVRSHDGAMVPLSIIYDKTKVQRDGKSIGYMYGYGSYGTSLTPTFRTEFIPLLTKGTVIAVAHIRGGGEKGNDWHLGGKKTNKPNTWKDFNACAEYLIQNKYVSAKKLAITGGSAGGILIGRAITERPDLYRVAIPEVGMMNTLRAEFDPNGPGNIAEFGTIKDETEFKSLLEMDAYHHIKKGENYPAILVTTGFNDPRVASYNPAKFAGKMQNENGSKNPVFLDVNYNAGHFGGSTKDEYFKEESKKIAFILWQCGHPDFQIK
ncbi:oligopeptidase B Serine peptidase. MEROPS family S09A [Epilithonimonas lactis]|nr:oligopeptidase B Serine peptidase. MEROPS family S09A [Epilithonimonas lactis]